VSDPAIVAISILLVLASFFFVGAEYALVGSRKSRVESVAKRGNKRAQRLLKHLNNISRLVAGNQIAITMIGIAIGSITEPFVTDKLSQAFGKSVPSGVSFALSYFLITYVLVVLGELIPKYLAIKFPERIAILTTPILAFATQLLSPLVWLAQSSANLLLKPLGIDLQAANEATVAKDELVSLLRGGQSDLESVHADFVARALRLDSLDANDIMVHRLDIKWLDINTPRAHLPGKIGKIPYSRIPVCRGDIDDVAGIVYLHDLVKAWDEEDFSLEKVLRQAVVVPENLTLDRAVTRMREDRTQILIVVDEYGGTSGLITLEDVVEEIFGELEDSLESEREVIEVYPSGRISARAEVRFDELIEKLGIELPDAITDTLAQMFAEELEGVPKTGDQLDSPIGKMRIENMARRRVTRVSIRLKPEYQAATSSK
jgi:putative hemolysin